MDLLIFDLDGTLIDSKQDLANSVNATRVHMGRRSSDNEEAASWVGNGAPVLIRRAMGPGASEAEVERALAYFLAYYREHMLDHTVLYPGVREGLDRPRAPAPASGGGRADGGAPQQTGPLQPRPGGRPGCGCALLSGLWRQQLRS